MSFRHRREQHKRTIFRLRLGRNLLTGGVYWHRLHWRFLLLAEGFYQPIAAGNPRNPACGPDYRHTEADNLAIVGKAEP
jgi:hypothetical protein